MVFLKFATFYLGIFQSKAIIWIRLERNIDFLNTLKKTLKVYWSQSEKMWFCMDTKSNRKTLQLDEHTFNWAFLNIHPVNQLAWVSFHETLRLKGYSDNTIKTYANELLQLLKILKSHPIDELSVERIKSYILYCIQTLGLSENLIHSRLNALKFYFEQVLLKDKFLIDIPRPNKPSKLPKVLSAMELLRLFESTSNIKHQVMLKMSYGMGLRVSEIVNLKIENIDSGRMMVHIQNAKGKQDRYVPLPEKLLLPLREYYKLHKPKLYLFEGMNGDMYSKRSVQAVFNNAIKTAKIKKKVGIHGLRHSYATHLMEQGTDMVFIQKLLGHAQIKTTEIYAKVSNRQITKIKSPLDNL